MMNVTTRTRWICRGVTVLLLMLAMYAEGVLAFGAYLSGFQNQYPTSGTTAAKCRVCHLGSTGGASWNNYGKDLLGAGAESANDITPYLIAVEPLDSDGNGISNIVEIQKGAQPGWCDPDRAGCTNPDTPPPVLLDP
jgi:hypothetical protein